jgi:hypothetical protein
MYIDIKLEWAYLDVILNGTWCTPISIYFYLDERGPNELILS